MSSTGGSKSGNPCERLIAPHSFDMRVIRLITESVNPDVLCESPRISMPQISWVSFLSSITRFALWVERSKVPSLAAIALERRRQRPQRSRKRLEPGVDLPPRSGLMIGSPRTMAP